jgi:hypothetical protein
MAVFVVLLVVVAGLAVAYLAWARGMLILPVWLDSRLPTPPAGLAQKRAPTTLAANGTPAAAAPKPQAASTDEDDLLSKLADSREPRLRALRKFGPVLKELQGELMAVELEAEPTATDTALRARQIEELQGINKELLKEYNEFEDLAAKADAPETEDMLAGLRQAFAERCGLWLDLLGHDYLNDPQIDTGTYVMADELVQAVAARGRLDPDAIQAHWTAAVRARQQRILDAAYATQYEEVGARISTVHELRRKFNDAAQQLGALNMGSGHLTPQAAALLEMYDDYANKLEAMWTDWKAYAATLPSASDLPDDLNTAVKRYVDLLKSEHLDCFTQEYRIYASDRRLDHPAYQHLKDHYQFAKMEWPATDGDYRAVFMQYEAEWTRLFGNGKSGGSYLPPPGSFGGSGVPSGPPATPPGGGGNPAPAPPGGGDGGSGGGGGDEPGPPVSPP